MPKPFPLAMHKSFLAAFGDSVNDIPMLEKAGIGVAMGNASDQVKQAADFVTASNDENGIVQFLRNRQIM